ncbi:MAG: PEP-CTERM sorting domain-containing protein, partial [Luteolibacter sp.]
LIALAAALVVASTVSSHGQDLSFGLTGSSSLLSTGVSRTYTSNGVTMTATAFSYTGGSNSSFFEAARLGRYSSGLGVTNRFENGSDPGHRVDNYQYNDYILFTFDTLVDVESIKIASIIDDSDVSYWLGNINTNTVAGKTYSGLASLGFQGEQIDMINASISSRTVNINSPTTGVNAILFGAQKGLDSGRTLDQFKVHTLKASVVIPEPSTALLSLLGVIGVCFRRRR